MGMTIDEDIEMLEYIRQDFRGCRQGVALQDAIDIMRKYQQIEQILKKTHEGCITKCQKIKEVVEDGLHNCKDCPNWVEDKEAETSIIAEKGA